MSQKRTDWVFACENLYLCEFFNAQYVRSILKFNMWLEKIIISIFYLICF